MKTRLEIIVETVSNILNEQKRKSTRNLSLIPRVTKLVHRAGGLGEPRAERILRLVDPTVAQEIRQDIRDARKEHLASD